MLQKQGCCNIMKNKLKITAILLSAVLLVSGCSGGDQSNEAESTDAAMTEEIGDIRNGLGLKALQAQQEAQTSTAEKEKTPNSPIEWFAAAEDKGNYTIMKVETSNGIEDFKLSTFKDQLLSMDTPTKLQTSNRVTACDESGIQIVYTEKDDGGISIGFCDVEVLKAAMDDSFCQVLHSKSTFFDMHMGTTTDYLTLSEQSMEEVESDIKRSGCYKSVNDGFTVTAYTNGGYTFYFILDVEARMLKKDSQQTIQTEKSAETTDTEYEPDPEFGEEESIIEYDFSDNSSVPPEQPTNYEEMWSVLPYIDETPVEDLVYYYSESDDGIIITGVKEGITEVRIPEEIDGKKVVDISLYERLMFSPYTPLIKELIIPDTVKTVSVDTSNVEYMNLPSGTMVSKRVGDMDGVYDGFDYYSSIKGLYLSSNKFNSSLLGDNRENAVVMYNGKKYDISNFDELDSITIPCIIEGNQLIRMYDLGREYAIKVPDNITDISPYAFKNCVGMTNIILPHNLTSIREGTFEGCTGLRRIVIRDGVETIEDAAFSGCRSLCELTIPNSVKQIGVNAFAGCYMDELLIPDSVETISIYGDNPWTAGAFTGSFIRKVTIGRSVKTIENAFLNSEGLEEVVLPDSLTSIGYSAFSNCIGLKSVIIPDGVTEIQGYAFSGCTGLTSITIPDSVTSIGADAFNGCNIKTLYLNSDVDVYGLFSDLETLIIGDSVETLHSFSGCTRLVNVELGRSLKKIENYAFSGCTSLESVDLPESVTVLGNNAFEGCSGLKEINLGKTLTYLGDRAFSGCTSLESVDIPEGITEFGTKFVYMSEICTLFDGCTSLKTVSLPDSLKGLGMMTFVDCDSLSYIKLPDNIEWIGGYFIGHDSNHGASVNFVYGSAMFITFSDRDESKYKNITVSYRGKDYTGYKEIEKLHGMLLPEIPYEYSAEHYHEAMEGAY